MTAPCTCAARTTGVACSCAWRDHLTKPITAIVGWLFDDGYTTEDATLTGLVYPDGWVEIQSLTIDATGDQVAVPPDQRREAEEDLRETAHGLWRREAS